MALRYIQGEDVVPEILNLGLVQPEPGSIDFNTLPAGVVEAAANEIWRYSAPPDTEALMATIERLRQTMSSFELQAENVVCAVFPSVTPEKTRSWPYAKLIEYAVRAEWILRNIHGLPLELAKSEQANQNSRSPKELRKMGVDPMRLLTPEQLTRAKPLPDVCIIGLQGWRFHNTIVKDQGGMPRR